MTRDEVRAVLDHFVPEESERAISDKDIENWLSLDNRVTVGYIRSTWPEIPDGEGIR